MVLKFSVFCLLTTVTLIFEARMAAASDGPSVAELTKKFEQLNQQSKSPTLPPKAKQIAQALQEELNKAENKTAPKIDTVDGMKETKIGTPTVPEKVEKQSEHVQAASPQKMPELKELIDLTKPWGLDLQKVAMRGNIYRNTPERNEKNVHEVAIEIDNLQMLNDYLKTVPKATKELKKKLDDDRLSLTDKIKEKLAQLNASKKKPGRKDKKELSLLISHLKDNQTQISKQFDMVKSATDAFKNPWYLEAEMNRKEDYIVEKLKEYGLTREHIKKLPPREKK